MKSIASRRLRNSALALIASTLVVAYAWWSAARLGRPDFVTGYLLLAMILFLGLYNIRKKLPIVAHTTSAGWLQAHIYVGLATAIVFGTHIGWQIPNGWLEGTLATLFAATFASGIVGLYWTRSIPTQLSRVSEEFIYERIPALRSHVHQRSQEVVLETVQATGSDTLGDFFNTRLQGYLEKPRGWGYWLKPSSKVRKRLLAELTEVSRYLSEPERKASEQLFALIRRRDDLDFHAALQWRLKMWLFVHIGLTYPLLMMACLHGWLAHLFDGGGL
jgi:hypothetical protein